MTYVGNAPSRELYDMSNVVKDAIEEIQAGKEPYKEIHTKRKEKINTVETRKRFRTNTVKKFDVK